MFSHLMFKYYEWRIVRAFRKQLKHLRVEQIGDWGVMSW
jgi:hypothetical protein